MRALVVCSAALVSLVASGVAAGAPLRAEDCESASRIDRGRVTCIGTLPSSHATVALKGLNGSRQHGVAEVTFGLHETKVVIVLKGAPAGVAQPARIRRGGCFGRSGLSLGSVVDGKRTARIDPLPHASGYSVVIYASAARRAIVACGVIPPHHKS